MHGVISSRSVELCTLETKDTLAPIFLYIHMHTSMCVCVCVCVYIYIYTRLCIHTYIHICQMEFNPYWLWSSWIRFKLCPLPSHMQHLTATHNSRHYTPTTFKSFHTSLHFPLVYTIPSVVVKVKVCILVPVMKAQCWVDAQLHTFLTSEIEVNPREVSLTSRPLYTIWMNPPPPSPQYLPGRKLDGSQN